MCHMASDELLKYFNLFMRCVLYVCVIVFPFYDLRCSAAVRCVSSNKIPQYSAESYPKNEQQVYSPKRQGREYGNQYGDRYANSDYRDGLASSNYGGYRNLTYPADNYNNNQLDEDYYGGRQPNYEPGHYGSPRYNDSYGNRYNNSANRSPYNRYQDRQYPYDDDGYGYDNGRYSERDPYTSRSRSNAGYEDGYDGYEEDMDEYDDDDDDDGYEDNRYYNNRTAYNDRRYNNETFDYRDKDSRRYYNDSYGYGSRYNGNYDPDGYRRNDYGGDNNYARPRRPGGPGPGPGPAYQGPGYNNRYRGDQRAYGNRERGRYDSYNQETCPIQTKETKSSHADIPTTAASAVLSTPNGDFILYCARSPAKTVLAYPLYCSGHGEDGMGTDGVSTAIDSTCFDIRVVDDVQNLQKPKHLVVTLSRGAYSAAYQVDYDNGGVRLLPCLHVFEYKYLSDVETVPLGDAGTLLAFSNNNIEPGAPYLETYAPIYLVRQGEIAICGFADVQHTTDVTSWKRFGSSVVFVYSQRRGTSRRSLLHLFEVRFNNGVCDVRRYKHQRTIGSAPYPGARNTLCASQPFTVDHCLCGVEDLQILLGPNSRDRPVHLAVALANNHKDENEVGCSDDEKLTPEGDASKAFCCCPWANQRSFVVAYSSGSRSFEFLNKSPQSFQQLYSGPASVTEISQLQTERCCPVFQTISPVGATELYTLEYTSNGELQVFVFKNHGLPPYAESSSYGYCQENDLIVSYTLHGFQSDNTIYHIRCNKGGLYSSNSYKQRYSKEYYTSRRPSYPITYTEAPRLVSYSSNNTHNRSTVYSPPQNPYNKTYPLYNQPAPVNHARLTVSQLENNYTLPYAPPVSPPVPYSSGNRSSIYQNQPSYLPSDNSLPSSAHAPSQDIYASPKYSTSLLPHTNYTAPTYQYNNTRPYGFSGPSYSLPVNVPATSYQANNYAQRPSYSPVTGNFLYAAPQQKSPTPAYSRPPVSMEKTYQEYIAVGSPVPASSISVMNADASGHYIYPNNQYNNSLLSSYNRLPYIQGYSNDIAPPAPAPVYHPTIHMEMADYIGYNESAPTYTSLNKSYPAPSSYLSSNYLPASYSYPSPSASPAAVNGIHAYDRRSSYTPAYPQGIRVGDQYNRRNSYQTPYG